MLEDEYHIDYFFDNEFVRKKCKSCGDYYWTRNPDKETCGDAPCDPYTFIGAPVFEEHDLDEMRELYLSFFERQNHKKVDRYPVVARWRDDIYLTIASIADFQPWVTSGKVPPPANPLTISQPCIRLEDLDVVGKSGRHLTTFEMMAHHAFNKKDSEIYWKDETLRYCEGLLKELKADLYKVTYKEVLWSGGGNAGPCLEVLIGGLEVATLVFMNLKYCPDGKIISKGERYSEMDSYIVDTGYGLERFVWASKGSPTVYDAVFPGVVNELMNLAGIEHALDDPEYANILSQNVRLSGLIDVRENLTELRAQVAKQIGISVDKLKATIEPVEMVYAIADHSRCLSFMFGDGIIPSNVKAGYLARLVLRRTLRMIANLKMDVPLSDIVALQIKYMDAYPEFFEKLDPILEIVDLEEKRYAQTIGRGKRLVEKISQSYKKEDKAIPLDKMVELYDTHGIPPEFTKDIAETIGVKANVPDNFYSIVADSHGKEKRQKEIDPLVERIKNLPKTKRLYYEDSKKERFEAVVLDIIDDYLVLDQTLFYPEGGGQPEDEGVITTAEEISHVSEVKNVEGVILHRVEKPILKGELIEGRINFQRRTAHSSHHTATHIVHEASKQVLGGHIWQAGAQKGVERSRLDISHFKRITPDEIKEIEMLSNRIVMANLNVGISILERSEAERKYGFELYQGGIPAGDEIRVVKVGGNVQACAGTHCKTTGEIGAIKILKTERIQDGVERIEFSAGEAAVKRIQETEGLISQSCETLKVPKEMLPKTVDRFFNEWKDLRKENERLKEALAEIRVKNLISNAPAPTDGIIMLSDIIEGALSQDLIKVASSISKSDVAAISILAGDAGGSASVVASCPKAAIEKGIKAGDIVKAASRVLGGGGGGKADLAQGGGPNIYKIDEALKEGKKVVSDRLKQMKD